MKLITLLLVTTGLLIFSCTDDKKSNTCGDDFVDIGEDCDNTNLNQQSCTSLGYHGGTLACTSNCQFNVSSCEEFGRCGNSTVEGNFEECDGLNLDSKTCGSLSLGGGSLNCTDNCHFDTSNCEQGGVCGNDVADGIENCDGDDLDGETCESLGYHGGTLLCDADCRYDFAQCETYGRCGDNEIQDLYEDCEGINLNGEDCESLGYYGGTLTCSNCQYNLTDCALYGICGDGLVQSDEGEICDGTDFDGATCISLGYYGGTLSCDTNCSTILTSCEQAGRCGDSIIQSTHSETCDTDNIGTETCQNLGYWTGTPGCNECQLVPQECNGFVAISSGNQSTFAIDKSGQGWAFGNNNNGKLGNGTETASGVPVMIDMPIGVTFTSISGGEQHACAIDQNSKLWCWGYNNWGNLGNHSYANALSPAEVYWASTSPDFVKVSAGGRSTCAVDTTGQAYCWGNSDYGQLGDGMFSSSDEPVLVTQTGGLLFADVSVGQNFACGISTSGNVYCWGRGAKNILGADSGGETSGIPYEVPIPSGVSFISIESGFYHACAISTMGQLYCWGSGLNGKLGQGDEVPLSSPTLVNISVSTGETIISVQCANSHTCAVTSTGKVWCWGDANKYKLGTGDQVDSFVPVQVIMPTGITFSTIATNYNHGCALDQYSNMWCWGENQYGQCGTGVISGNNVSLETIVEP
ncbi:hypothetical protein KKF34_06280 [Myxococcota bacterium]|nr:hypothetical protein [Myxococcota bacterium]MBU1381774.1 hypothetical protein [Myxococcota bacterium]MBU1496466.1 hypothetical protein [Myxococcota bacterium]